MKAVKLNIDNYFAKHVPGNENLQILGGNVKLEPEQLVDIAAKFNIHNYQIDEAEVLDATVRPFKLKYYHYTLSYGESSPFWDNEISL